MQNQHPKGGFSFDPNGNLSIHHQHSKREVHNTPGDIKRVGTLTLALYTQLFYAQRRA